MRLKSIKLAGFKSFVDPTIVHFPTNMSAVVGPNGCGKSNIIDAVRWVMGESSAKYLRGESMTDVIFNGSNARKPIGQASVELVFDNSDKTLTGEYAAFNEIGLRRKVTREGDSSYFLNGTKCRRRDITDIFLGTGLGPRSYAIIEQGMISKLIEAKPEDLRVYIEEAAGISRYKERRRDTENRIRRTRENLERLSDIRDELERQLQHLDRQAKTAARYKLLKQDERSKTALLHALQWQALTHEKTVADVNISARQTELEAALAAKLKAESIIEKQRLNHTDQNDAFNRIQSQYYSLGADIARNEQRINGIQEREHQLRQDLDQASHALTEVLSHITADNASVESAHIELEGIRPQLALEQSAEEEASAVLEQAQTTMQDWQQQWDEFNARSSQSKQTAEVEQSRIQYIEQALQGLTERGLSLQSEQQNLAEQDVDDMDALEFELEELSAQLEQQNEQQELSSEQIASSRVQLSGLNSQINEQISTQQRCNGRLSALEALQQNASMQGVGAEAWLQDQGLQSASRLVDSLHVELGWEKAVETVLGQMLQAVAVDDLDRLKHSDFSDALGLSLFEIEAKAVQGVSGDLAKKVSGSHIASLLNGIYCVDDVEQALSQRGNLKAGESCITPDGIWLGSHWLKMHTEARSNDSVLQRQTEISALQHEADTLTATLEQLAQEKAMLSESLNLSEQEAKQGQQAVRELNQLVTQKSSAFSASKVRQHERSSRVDKTALDIAQNKDLQVIERESLSEHRLSLEAALAALAEHTETRELLLFERDAKRDALETVRDTARRHKEQLMSLSIRQQGLLTQVESAQQTNNRMEQQRLSLQDRIDSIDAQFEANNEPLEDCRIELEEKLQLRIEVEQALAAARDQIQVIDTDIRALELARSQAEAKANDVRTLLEQERVSVESLRVQLINIEHQLKESETSPEVVLAGVEVLPSQAELNNELERIQASVRRLGAINLAAIDEYEQQSERKHYLDAQNEDLLSALDTLEHAIRKIDKETRSRFKDTFDEVNAGIGELFPQVFGGGQAYLELTGDDLLDTGITIMARPPGKKNSTIHLLSGGEKALTAIALVFAIFRLNPAPFCMLDEVDAPLDDANVGRYAKMVKAMSSQVQFIYITHNKIPMEFADQLMGVTMHEPGVSRLVTVDIEKAAAMAAL